MLATFIINVSLNKHILIDTICLHHLYFKVTENKDINFRDTEHRLNNTKIKH